MRHFHLLQHRIRLAAGIYIARQHQQRDVVRRRRRARRNHIRRARSNRRCGDHDLLALHLLGKCHRDVRLSLLIFSLIYLHPPRFLFNALSKPHHVSVSGQHQDSTNERLLHIVIRHILIFQKAYQRLTHR